MNRPRRVGLPWYESEHYDALRQILTDGASLPATYEAWRIATEQVEGVVQRSGVEVVRVPIEPDDFAAWCERGGSARDGAARVRYAEERLADRAPNEERTQAE